MDARVINKKKILTYLKELQATVVKVNKFSISFKINNKDCKLSLLKGKRSLGRTKQINYNCTLLKLDVNNEYWETVEALYNIEITLDRMFSNL